MQNLLSDLTQLLEQDDRLVAEGKLLKNKIVELALALDSGLIKLLLKHEGIRRHFFVEVEEVLVFDKIKLQQFISNKQFLSDSYTAFKNKIGLTAAGERAMRSCWRGRTRIVCWKGDRRGKMQGVILQRNLHFDIHLC